MRNQLSALTAGQRDLLRCFWTDEEAFEYLVTAFDFLKPLPQTRFNWNQWSDEDFRSQCRFASGDIVTAARLFGLPSTVKTRSGYCLTAEEALLLFLVWFAAPIPLHTMELFLGYNESLLSECIAYIMVFLYKEWDVLLQDVDSGLLTEERLANFAEKIHAKGVPLDKVWGFIDCTIRRICRPGLYQRQAYNGHKKFHALKYSAVKCPDGLIYHLYGPFEGRRNDNALLSESGLLDRCRATIKKWGYYLYGDSAYPVSSVLLAPYAKSHLTPEEHEWNLRMSSVRECVEWGFWDVLRLWGRLEYKLSQKIYQTRPGVQYRVGVLLTNVHSCFYFNETAVYFACAPPKPYEYLRKSVQVPA